jgi:hypothetical protein
VKFTAQTMNGQPFTAVIDKAVAVWHKDGTEIMNSSRPAQDGNFCPGVWAHTGDHAYHLNHIAWQGNDPTNAPGIGNPQGGAQIIEDVVLDRDADSYSGIFTLTAYDPAGNVEVSFTGVITATRITPDTPFSDLLNWCSVSPEKRTVEYRFAVLFSICPFRSQFNPSAIPISSGDGSCLMRVRRDLAVGDRPKRCAR